MRMNKLPYILSLLLVSINATASTLEVGRGKAYETISGAVSTAEKGDTVLIYEGVYQEGTIEVRTPIVIVGVNNPVLDGENKYEILRVWVDSVVVMGLTLKDVGVSYVEDRSAIRFIKSKHGRIESNRLINAFFGIYLEHCRDIIIRDNMILGEAEYEMNSGNAIHLWYCRDIIIEGNYAEGHRDGI